MLNEKNLIQRALEDGILNKFLIDPFGGLKDLKDKKIRLVGGTERFDEDPLRMLRAVRFACQLGFSLDLTMPHPEQLQNISQERKQAELDKILATSKPEYGIKLLVDYGLMKYVISEVDSVVGVDQGKHHKYDVYNHTLNVINNVSKLSYSGEDKKVLMLTALLHDIGKPKTKSGEGTNVHFYNHEDVSAEMTKDILTNLKYDNKTIDRVQTLVRNHMRPLMLAVVKYPERGIAKFVREVGNDNALMLIDFAICDAKGAGYEPKIEEEFKEKVKEVINKKAPSEVKSPLSGQELMEKLKLEPSKKVGEIKEHLIDKVLSGELEQEDKDKALKIAQEYLTKKSLSESFLSSVENYISKSKVYIKEGDKVPKGVSIKTGPKDGKYYESSLEEQEKSKLKTNKIKSEKNEVKNFNLELTRKERGLEEYALKVGSAKADKWGQDTVGEISVSFNPLDKGDLHIDFVEIDESLRGKGLLRRSIENILEKHPKMETLSGDLTNKRAYFAMKKILGDPEYIADDVKTMSEKRMLERLPDKGEFIYGEMDSGEKIFVRWKIDKLKSINKDQLKKDIVNLLKEKIYLKPGEKAPEGVQVKTGEREGKYYETSGREPTKSEEQNQSSKQNTNTESKLKPNSFKVDYTNEMKIGNEVLDSVRKKGQEVEYAPLGNEFDHATISTLKDNADKHLEQYEQFLDASTFNKIRSTAYEIINDGSKVKGKFSPQDLQELSNSSINKLMYQEIIAWQTQLSDHGVRHIYGNIDMSSRMSKAMNEAGLEVSPEEEFMIDVVMINHDLGYTVKQVKGNVEETKNHSSYSRDWFNNERKVFAKYFDEKQLDDIENYIENHSQTEIDWENNKLLSIISTADNLSIFQNEKLPSLFKYVDGSIDILFKMQKAIQDKDKEAFKKEKENLNTAIDKTNLPAYTKSWLRQAASEVSESTPKYTIPMLIGRIDGFDFSKDTGLSVDVQENTFDSQMADFFDMGQGAYVKLVDSYGADLKDKDEIEFTKNGKKRMQIHIKREKIEKSKVYVDSPDQVPEGKVIQTGSRDGKYYESSSKDKKSKSVKETIQIKQKKINDSEKIFASKVKDSKIERCIIWNSNGEEILSQDGESGGVTLSKEQVEKTKNAHEMIHNHAYNSHSFSTGDIGFMMEANIKRMIVTDGISKWIMEAGKWKDGIEYYDIRKAFENKYSDLMDERTSRKAFAEAKIKEEELDWKKVATDSMNDAWQYLADNNILGEGFHYSKEVI